MVILNKDPKNIKQRIKAIMQDSVANFLYYDRKEDEDLPTGEIENAVEDGTITPEEIINFFKAELDIHLKEYLPK